MSLPRLCRVDRTCQAIEAFFFFSYSNVSEEQRVPVLSETASKPLPGVESQSSTVSNDKTLKLVDYESVAVFIRTCHNKGDSGGKIVYQVCCR